MLSQEIGLSRVRLKTQGDEQAAMVGGQVRMIGNHSAEDRFGFIQLFGLGEDFARSASQFVICGNRGDNFAETIRRGREISFVRQCPAEIDRCLGMLWRRRLGPPEALRRSR